MDLTTIKYLFLRELRSTVRERNVVLYVILVPLLLYPLLIWLAMSTASLLSAEQERSPLRLAVTGSNPYLTRMLEQEHFLLTQSDNPTKDIQSGQADGWLDISSEKHIIFVYDGRYRQARQAQTRLLPLLHNYRNIHLEKIALGAGASWHELQPLLLKVQDESSASDRGRFLLGTFLPLCLLVVLSLGGLYPAIETLAGEHERHTLDTTMGLAVSRKQLILAKYLLVVSLCCISGICNLLAMAVSLRAILTPFTGDVNDKINWGLSPENILTMLIGILTMSMLVAAATLTCTAHARTFRQGQAAATPLFMSILLPSAALIDRSLYLDINTCWIPILNVALLWRDSLTDGVSLQLVLMTLACSLAWVWLILTILSWRLSRQGRAMGFW